MTPSRPKRKLAMQTETNFKRLFQVEESSKSQFWKSGGKVGRVVGEGRKAATLGDLFVSVSCLCRKSNTRHKLIVNI
jgi:hypothetical protein